MTVLTYVYCLIRSTRRPALPAGIESAGMPGGRETRALPVSDGVWAIVTGVPAAEYDEAALARGLQNLDWVGRRAMAHEAVVEQFLSARAVLPMQLFTLFTADDRAVEHFARQAASIEAILTRVERKLEWGVRLSFDEQAFTAAQARQEKPAHRESGVAYLARKRDQIATTRGQIVELRQMADRVFTAIAGAAAEARRHAATEQATPGSRVVLDAAFLVPATRTAAFRKVVAARVKEAEADGLVASLSGPWPPYNFIAPPKDEARGTAR